MTGDPSAKTRGDVYWTFINLFASGDAMREKLNCKEIWGRMMQCLVTDQISVRENCAFALKNMLCLNQIQMTVEFFEHHPEVFLF